jgi:2'-5' RNA ligase
MPYALELGLDDHAAAVVRRLWHDLEDEGIVHMARSGARPHVSVGIWDSLDRDAAETELTRFAAEAAPLPITLASVGFFPQVAIFLAPTVTSALLELQAGLHARFSRVGAAQWEHYRPGVWVPHCTLATDFMAEQFTRALEVARRVALPLACRLVEIGIVEFRPVKPLISRSLSRP